jgi:hypothetical protein
MLAARQSIAPSSTDLTCDETGRIGRILKLPRDILTALFDATSQGAAETITGDFPCNLRSLATELILRTHPVHRSLTRREGERKHRFANLGENTWTRPPARSVLPRAMSFTRRLAFALSAEGLSDVA